MDRKLSVKNTKDIENTAVDLTNEVLYGDYSYRKKDRRGTCLFLVFLLLMIITFCGCRGALEKTWGRIVVSGFSLQPTLQDGDKLIMRLVDGTEAERGDIIVVDVRKYPQAAHLEFLIKRLIAVEGDVVECEDGQIYITYAGTSERVALEESYVYYSSTAGKLDYDFGKYTVGAGEIFFLGDNRLNSTDSRYQEQDKQGRPIGSHIKGLYKASDIIGVVPEWSVKMKSFFQVVFF